MNRLSLVLACVACAHPSTQPSPQAAPAIAVVVADAGIAEDARVDPVVAHSTSEGEPAVADAGTRPQPPFVEIWGDNGPSPYDVVGQRLVAVDVRSCGSAAFHGHGRVKIVFDPSGVVTHVEVEATNIPKATSNCISRRFMAVRGPVFGGDAPTPVRMGFTIP